MKKLLLAFVLVAIIVIGGALTYVKTFLPNVGDAPDITIEITPERVARGKYIANNVAVCIDCHSQRDWGTFAAPPIEGTFGGGGEIFSEDFGFPGNYYSKNITPYGIGDWTDGEVLRAITTGVSKEGNALFPIMPYPHYGTLTEEDLYSIIAYVRSLEPIKKDIPASTSNFPINFLINTMPQPAKFGTTPDKNNKVEYGRYLTNMAGCIECHTKQEKGQLLDGMHFAGGFDFKLPMGTVTSPNITPDKATGIGTWNEDMFVARFKQYADSNYIPQKVGENDFQTVMPWTMYAGMEENDLRAMFAYLRSLEPINNPVATRFTPAD